MGHHERDGTAAEPRARRAARRRRRRRRRRSLWDLSSWVQRGVSQLLAPGRHVPRRGGHVPARVPRALRRSVARDGRGARRLPHVPPAVRAGPAAPGKQGRYRHPAAAG